MERNIDMKEVSDGRLYTSNDLVKADCGGCEGCSACCQGMGESIVLDPLDIHRLCCGLHTDFNGLMVDKIELQIVDSVILPNLKMASGNTEACSFLNPEGRCSIHAFRPGICRLFPLGRYYENGDFQYFLQTRECSQKDRSKVQAAKWIDVRNVSENHKFVNGWHSLLLSCEKLIAENSAEESLAQNVSMYLLQAFYGMPYSGREGFFEEFWHRMKKAKEDLGV